MSTEEIIRRLGEIKAVYPEALGNAIGKEETAADLKALTAAIQAVERLEEVKTAARGGTCSTCGYATLPLDDKRRQLACKDCYPDRYNRNPPQPYDAHEFRHWSWIWDIPPIEDTTT